MLHPYFFACLLIAALSISSGNAQTTCTVDTNNYEMITPESDSLPCVERNTPYTAVLQLFCPPQIASIDIYSIVVSAFGGFPSGISYTCNPPTCTIYPWTHACIAISGVTSDTAGDYQLTYAGYAQTGQGTATFDYLQGLGFIPEYQLKVIEPGEPCRETQSTGVNLLDEVPGMEMHVYPNPSAGRFQIAINADRPVSGQLIITDVVGKAVYTQNIPEVSRWKNQVDLSSYPKGLYTVLLKTGNGISTAKVSLN